MSADVVSGVIAEPRVFQATMAAIDAAFGDSRDDLNELNAIFGHNLLAQWRDDTSDVYRSPEGFDADFAGVLSAIGSYALNETEALHPVGFAQNQRAVASQIGRQLFTDVRAKHTVLLNQTLEQGIDQRIKVESWPTRWLARHDARNVVRRRSGMPSRLLAQASPTAPFEMAQDVLYEQKRDEPDDTSGRHRAVLRSAVHDATPAFLDQEVEAFNGAYRHVVWMFPNRPRR